MAFIQTQLMKPIYLIVILIFITSCVPVKVAPRFKNQDYKIVQAKKFKRKLARETSFIFKDPKEAGHFYDYINTKYNLNGVDVGLNTPINVNGATYYLSYYETDKEDKTLNVAPVLIDEVLDTNTLEGIYTSRKGHWYILITIYDNKVKNTLVKSHPMRKKIEDYLVALKQEYLTTTNYQELHFKKKP